LRFRKFFPLVLPLSDSVVYNSPLFESRCFPLVVSPPFVPFSAIQTPYTYLGTRFLSRALLLKKTVFGFGREGLFFLRVLFCDCFSHSSHSFGQLQAWAAGVLLLPLLFEMVDFELKTHKDFSSCPISTFFSSSFRFPFRASIVLFSFFSFSPFSFDKRRRRQGSQEFQSPVLSLPREKEGVLILPFSLLSFSSGVVSVPFQIASLLFPLRPNFFLPLPSKCALTLFRTDCMVALKTQTL